MGLLKSVLSGPVPNRNPLMNAAIINTVHDIITAIPIHFMKIIVRFMFYTQL